MHGHAHGAWTVEDVDVPVRGKTSVRQARAFVVARHDEDGDAALGDPAQRLECLISDGRVDLGAIENVAGMDDQVDFTLQRGRQRTGIIGQEVMAAPPPLHARPLRQVESEMSVGE